MSRATERIQRILPNLTPKYIRCYDSPKYADRYTIVFTGNFPGRNGRCYTIGCSVNPYHPQGIGSHEDYDTIIDRPKYAHLGKKVKYKSLPPMVQYAVLWDYIDYWKIPRSEEIKAEFERLNGKY